MTAMAAVQDAGGAQTPEVQVSPATQSLVLAQVVLQAVAPHTYWPQVLVTGAGQVPVPVQVAAAVAVPLAQLAARQVVVAVASAQVPAPVQVPVFPQGGAATQRVSAAPAVTFAQVPLVPPVLAAEQAVQAPAQATLQQNPSTQNPEPHWFVAVQVPPFAFLGVQAPDAQKSPAMQSVSALQVVLQAVAPQVSGAQLVGVGVAQAPAPLQLAAGVAKPLVQLAAAHTVVVGASAQVPVAVQVPVLPHGGAATQRLSVAPASRLAQVPLAPPVRAFEQAVQAPVQAALQQNPSAQNPDPHWFGAVQAAPLARHVPPAHSTQRPLVHWAPAAQFAALVQVVVQAVDPHT